MSPQPSAPSTELRIPEHVAIIMDGNGRWAKQRGLPRTDGHIRGQDALRATLRAAAEFGIRYLTVYAFSTENWSRPQEEVDALMSLLVSAIHSETPSLIEEGVRLEAIGNLSRLPEAAQQALRESIQATAGCERITLIVALSYSSRDEILRATTQIACEVAEGRLSADSLTEETISAHLDTAAFPDPDLLIRTVARSVSATTCSGRPPMLSSSSHRSTGPTSAVRPCVKPSRLTRHVSAALARQANKYNWRTSLR